MKKKTKKRSVPRSKRLARRTSRSGAKSVPVATRQKPKKLRGNALRYQRLLLGLRDHLLDAINTTAGQTLNRSQRDSSGDISGYPTHLADVGSEDFDRDFALSFVSSEQEGLYEIAEALKRLEINTFGICEMCSKPIKKARLKAVPFARFCLPCQTEVEKEKKAPAGPTMSLEDTAEEEAAEETAEE